LSTKASAFQPQQAALEAPVKQPLKHRFAEVISWAKKAMQELEHVARVEFSEGASGWSITIQTHGLDDSGCQTEHLIAKAKEALLDATSKSKSVYIMGYCSPKPFVMRSQGFEATLGAMENAKSACWHVFKKGFCRHGANCCKTHPAVQVPVQVLVVKAQFNADERFVGAFKQEVADLTMATVASLAKCTYAEKVEAVKDKASQGWNIEVMPKEELKPHKDYLLSLAKDALFTATGNSSMIYIMGYAANPFVSKSQGFVTMVGDMQDETRACWDLYSKGSCSKDCTCRWEHPECLVPINVVVKERSSLKCSPAVLEYLAGNGMINAAQK